MIRAYYQDHSEYEVKTRIRISLYILLGIVLALLILTIDCFAEDVNNSLDVLKNINVTIVSDKAPQQIKSETEDEKIANAITNASYYAYFVGEDKIFFDFKTALLVVKECRYDYEKEHPKIDFIEYIKEDLNNHYANCSGWFKYYNAFKED